ncbi:MAG: phosphoglucomutase/phosphomannomutase family protein [Armatimonadetes bacterium]|nr:phosphoglucomutase/phosphomannomutase family protein [Armatimonadota bacterium]
MSQITFGTDGWRGIIARDFTFANVELVARAVAAYVKARGLAARGVIVGYDNRFLSDQFAQTVAGVLGEEGVPVCLVEKSAPTPVVAFAIKEAGAGGAVMLTASHNPPEYNGIKFIPEYAGPALPHITKEIEENIRRLSGEGRPGGGDRAPGVAGQPQRKIDPRPAYFAHVKKLIDFAAIGRAGLKVIVDPMYGAGTGYLEELLREAGAQVEAIHDRRDPLFGGALPDPSAKSLTELRARVLAAGADLGLALDGDADRFGLIDRDGSYIPPNQYLPVVYDHLLNTRGWRGPVVRTVATTHLLDRLAAAAGEQAFETPVGFKYIGRYLLEKNCVAGGEESGGLSIRGHVPEKDGVLAGLLAAEIVARHRQSLGDRLRGIWARVGRLFSERLDIHTTPAEKERVLAALKNLAPAAVAGKKVTRRLTVDGTKLVFEDGSWLLIRPSGTEPLFRCYVEANTPEDLEAIQDWCRALFA